MKKLLFIMMSMLLCIGLTACADNSDSSDTAANQSLAEKDEENAEESDEESEEEIPAEVSIGETITIGDWQITVNSFELLDSIQNDSRIFEADEGCKYVTVNLTVTNTGAETLSFAKGFVIDSDILCSVYYQEIDTSSSVQLLSYEEDLHYREIAPSETVTGILAHSIEEEKALSGELTFVVSLGDQTCIYKLI